MLTIMPKCPSKKRQSFRSYLTIAFFCKDEILFTPKTFYFSCCVDFSKQCEYSRIFSDEFCNARNLKHVAHESIVCKAGFESLKFQNELVVRCIGILGSTPDYRQIGLREGGGMPK